MLIEFRDCMPVVFLTAEVTDTESEDSVVEGQEELEGESSLSEDGSEGTVGEAGGTAKEPLLSSTVFVGGVSLAVFVIGGVLGFFLAKKKIKKGIELYEDI